MDFLSQFMCFFTTDKKTNHQVRHRFGSLDDLEFETSNSVSAIAFRNCHGQIQGVPKLQIRVV